MKKKISILNKLRNYFIAGIVAIIPIGITLYLTMFIIDISSKLIPKEINPNNYLPFSIPGLEIIISIIVITFIGGISVSFIGKKILQLVNERIQVSRFIARFAIAVLVSLVALPKCGRIKALLCLR